MWEKLERKEPGFEKIAFGSDSVTSILVNLEMRLSLTKIIF